jgi:hypothetical protein
MTLDFLFNGQYLHLNFDVTSCDFHHHVTSVKAVITIQPREVITVRSLVKNTHRLAFICSFVVLPVHQADIKLFPKSQIHIITVTWATGGEYK